PGCDPAAASLPRDLDAAMDEIFVTCVSHPDVQAFCQLFPRARKIYTPHGFDSLHASEVMYYDPVLSGSLQPRPLRPAWWTDMGKRVAWGQDAVPVRQLRLDELYTFNQESPWPVIHHALNHWLALEPMRALFGRLPAA